jgi:hypothetical protein
MFSFDHKIVLPSIEGIDDLFGNTRTVDENIDRCERLDAWWMVQSVSEKGHISRETRQSSESNQDGDEGRL